MKTSISFLSSSYSFSKTIELINISKADFIHIDVMDGLFVNNRTPFQKEMLDILKKSKKAKEVHLMTLHLKQFIDVFSYIEPEIIIYEYEATSNHEEIIEYIKEKNCKVGIAINPLTDIEKITPYLKKVDMVLIMSVIPGYGGQQFIKATKNRILELQNLRDKKELSYLIHVDGGIDDKVMPCLKDTKIDRVVLGSYVCKSANFDKQIEKVIQ